jgi:hypothetical protein
MVLKSQLDNFSGAVQISTNPFQTNKKENKHKTNRSNFKMGLSTLSNHKMEKTSRFERQ